MKTLFTDEDQTMNTVTTAILNFFTFPVFLGDKLCSTLRTVSYFLTRAEFSRKDAEAVWKKFRTQRRRRLQWHFWQEVPGRWDEFLKDLG
jgi:hypothetical protein